MFKALLFAVALLPTMASAQTALTFDKTNVKPGLTLAFVDNKRRASTLTLISRTKFRSSSGETSAVNADGNTVKSGKRRIAPHSGYRPPGAGGALRVGMKWSHKFTVDGVSRRRSCRVAKSGTYKNRHVVVANAFLVRCTNQRADRAQGMQERIWFAPALFTPLAYKASWSGGGFGWELTGVK